MAARKLAAYVHVGGSVFAPGDRPEKEYADQITNPKAWGEVDDGDAPEEDVPYAKRKKADLEDLVAERNATRPEADALDVGNGTVKELAAALDADDAAQV